MNFPCVNILHFHFCTEMTDFFINGRNFAWNTRKVSDNVHIVFDNIVAATFLYVTNQVSLRESEISHSEKCFFYDLSSTNFTRLLSQPAAAHDRSDVEIPNAGWPRLRIIVPFVVRDRSPDMYCMPSDILYGKHIFVKIEHQITYWRNWFASSENDVKTRMSIDLRCTCRPALRIAWFVHSLSTYTLLTARRRYVGIDQGAMTFRRHA